MHLRQNFCSVNLARQYQQCDIRGDIEQQNAHFVDSHSSVMNAVEAFFRHEKPSTMEPEHPVMRKQKRQKPAHDDTVIDDAAPKKKVTCQFNIQGFVFVVIVVSSMSLKQKRASLWPFSSCGICLLFDQILIFGMTSSN